MGTAWRTIRDKRDEMEEEGSQQIATISVGHRNCSIHTGESPEIHKYQERRVRLTKCGPDCLEDIYNKN